MKQRIKLNESQLHRIIRESVNKVLNEIGDTSKGQEVLGYLCGRRDNYDAWDKAWDKHDTKNEKGERIAHPSFYKSYLKGVSDREKSYPSIVQDIANNQYFWMVDFDRNAWNLPKNWKSMDRLDRAKYIYDNSDWTDEEWQEYLNN